MSMAGLASSSRSAASAPWASAAIHNGNHQRIFGVPHRQPRWPLLLNGYRGSVVDARVEDEAQLADAISRYGYNVQLVFAEQTGAFLADVNLHITDAAGNTVLDTVSEGPMFLAKLPPGQYRVAAQANGAVRTATVDASRGAKRTTLVWPATTDKQGNAVPTGSPR
jgi:hypothetical protein